jgi:hypothetical protein
VIFFPPQILLSNFFDGTDAMERIEKVDAENERLNAKFEQNLKRITALHQQADTEHWHGQIFKRLEEA